MYFSSSKKAETTNEAETITISIILIANTVFTLIKKALKNKKANPKTKKEIEIMRNFLFFLLNSSYVLIE